jgi:hypothetical protein
LLGNNGRLRESFKRVCHFSKGGREDGELISSVKGTGVQTYRTGFRNEWNEALVGESSNALMTWSIIISLPNGPKLARGGGVERVEIVKGGEVEASQSSKCARSDFNDVDK